MKLSPKQKQTLQIIGERNGFYSPWSLGTATCEALRKRGLVEGNKPFTGAMGDHRSMWISPAGRALLLPARRAGMILTKRQRDYLEDLAQRQSPIAWTGPNKAMGNKLVSIGAAVYRVGYPVGFRITPYGLRLLGLQHGGDST